MPVAPVAGVPPRSTLAGLEHRFENFPTPCLIAPGLNPNNFYAENGQIILASIVSLMMLIFFFLLAPLSGSLTFF